MKPNHFEQESADMLAAIMGARRDVRGNRFIDKPVAADILSQIFAAAEMAPSVGFSQPWEFVVVNNMKTRRALVDNFNQVSTQAQKAFSQDKQEQYAALKLEGIMEAPVNIAVFYRPSRLPVLGQSSMEETGRYSVVCAIQNMWLMARALNVGMGWVSILEAAFVKEQLNAPKDAELVAYLCLGYVNEFLEQPELEKLNWERRKSIRSCILEESY
ncbi:5,6-dimethylbenzimidazole synthase [Aliikangiella sp. G2MR2-5]|uniref:5,6-dimethylbenzimidazole synthase n=1 Tax=Aliikangiella sp. G2MR2-5 TaxID=2788943 RepID=UPI0018AC7DA3|nr:5,6-dimethylbenzimidazole synthase [Aliikangiella sp. G2MR2-5]